MLRWQPNGAPAALMIVLALLALPAGSAWAEPAADRQRLTVRLDPAARTLRGELHLRPRPHDRSGLTLSLAPQAIIDSVTRDGLPVDFRFEAGRLRIPAASGTQRPAPELRIVYRARFDDPYPETPLNTDNPGYGVAGIVGPEGTFLLGGSGWYPRRPGGPDRIDLAVDAPAGTVAVTAGVWQGAHTAEGRTVTRWQAHEYGQPLALSAGPYRVDERQVGTVRLATYFTADTAHLSEAYLDGAERFLRRYEPLFGPYPYPQFAVLENFFPTGYGFPSYTLIGGRVLRLPFIIETSLAHELVHCWWGNAVGVDASEGNWAEGLATYAADYLARELHSPEAARDHRRQMLRNYAELVDPALETPLGRFSRRYDPASKAVGYDKGAMVFHMLRRRVGDAAFWGALQDLYREKRFDTAAWSDLQRAFQHRSPGSDLAAFFAQWVERPGAPRLSFEGMTRRRTADGWRVGGTVVQEGTPFALATEVAISTEAGEQRHPLVVAGRKTFFMVPVATPPRRLVLDPDFDLLRRLAPGELPPTVNRLRGSTTARLVVAAGAGEEGRLAARVLGVALGLAERRILAEADLTDAAGWDLIFVGWPFGAAHRPPAPAPVSLSADRFATESSVHEGPEDVFFGVFSRPAAPGRVTALLYPAGAASSAVVARKVAHYGRYSYLAFRAGRNTAKGTWPVTDSPLVHEWPASPQPAGKEGADEK